MLVCKKKMEEFMPHLSHVASQVVYACMNIINTVALEDGMNNFIFVTYRQIIGTLVIVPLDFFLERYELVNLFFYKNNANLCTILYYKKHITRLINDDLYFDLYISTNHNRRYITVNMPSIYYHCKHKRPPMTLSIFFRFSFFHSLGN